MKRPGRQLAIFLIMTLLAIAIPACGSESFTIDDIWARPGLMGGNSAVYFVVNNPTDQDDQLLSAESGIAQRVELHMSQMKDDGTMTMQKQESVPIPSDGSVEFKPGGLHVMLINLNDDLTAGDIFELVLNLENKGKVELEVTVREP